VSKQPVPAHGKHHLFGIPHPARHRLDPRYPLGCTVRHARFGEGTVLAVEGLGTDCKITVHFVNCGRKTLVEKYAGLEKVS